MSVADIHTEQLVSCVAPEDCIYDLVAVSHTTASDTVGTNDGTWGSICDDGDGGGGIDDTVGTTDMARTLVRRTKDRWPFYRKCTILLTPVSHPSQVRKRNGFKLPKSYCSTRWECLRA